MPGGAREPHKRPRFSPAAPPEVGDAAAPGLCRSRGREPLLGLFARLQPPLAERNLGGLRGAAPAARRARV